MKFTDFDESQSGSYVGHAQGQCVNVVGSYDCRCLPGYAGDGRHTCSGIWYQCEYRYMSLSLSFSIFFSFRQDSLKENTHVSIMKKFVIVKRTPQFQKQRRSKQNSK